MRDFSALRTRLEQSRPDCTKIARFSAVAAAIFTAPPQNRAIFKAPRCAISSAKKIASERRFSLRLKGTNLIPTAEFPAIPESAAKIASERRCAILVHSGADTVWGVQRVALEDAVHVISHSCQGSSNLSLIVILVALFFKQNILPDPKLWYASKYSGGVYFQNCSIDAYHSNQEFYRPTKKTY